MEHILIKTQSEVIPGQCIPRKILDDSGIKPTGIDCFEYSPYMLFQNGNKRYVLQPMPANNYKVIKVYNFVPANYS